MRGQSLPALFWWDTQSQPDANMGTNYHSSFEMFIAKITYMSRYELYLYLSQLKNLFASSFLLGHPKAGRGQRYNELSLLFRCSIHFLSQTSSPLKLAAVQIWLVLFVFFESGKVWSSADGARARGLEELTSERKMPTHHLPEHYSLSSRERAKDIFTSLVKVTQSSVT